MSEAQKVHRLVQDLESWIPKRIRLGYDVSSLDSAVERLNDLRLRLLREEGAAWDGKVEIQYFRHSGRYYTSGEYITEVKDRTNVYAVHAEVRDKFARGDYPGLVSARPQYHALVLVPGHPYEHPLLIPASVAE